MLLLCYYCVTMLLLCYYAATVLLQCYYVTTVLLCYNAAPADHPPPHLTPGLYMLCWFHGVVSENKLASLNLGGPYFFFGYINANDINSFHSHFNIPLR